MTVATYVAPDYTAQSGSGYAADNDGAHAVARRIIDMFAPHEHTGADMKVGLDAGAILSGVTLTEVAAQDTGTITAPVTNPRIDRVVIDASTGAVSVVGGTENASPTAPAIPSGKLPVAQVLLQTTSVAITNSMITDERVPGGSSGGGLTAATQAQMEAASSTTVYGAPGNLLYHPGVAKAVIIFGYSGSLTTAFAWNASVTRSSAGQYNVQLSGLNFSQGYATVTGESSTPQPLIGSPTQGGYFSGSNPSFDVEFVNASGTDTDPKGAIVTVYGNLV